MLATSLMTRDLRLHAGRQRARAAGGHQDRLHLHRVDRAPRRCSRGPSAPPSCASRACHWARGPRSTSTRWRRRGAHHRAPSGQAHGRGVRQKEQPGPRGPQPGPGRAGRVPGGGAGRRLELHEAELHVDGVEVGRHRILRCTSAAVPNAIAALLPSTCATARGQIPHAYFGWTEGNPVTYVLKLPGARRGRHRARHARGAPQVDRATRWTDPASTWASRPRGGRRARQPSALVLHVQVAVAWATSRPK